MYLIQLYFSHPRVKFENFCRNYWNVPPDFSALEYDCDNAERAWKRISGLLDVIETEPQRNSSKPNQTNKIIVFPENTIPRGKEDDLIRYSNDLQAVIVGGLVHFRPDNCDYYVNEAIIIEGNNVGYQVKQTPTLIRSKEIQEKIITRKQKPSINIFETSFGKMAIFICKDYLRFRNIIPTWAIANDVEFIIVPALTSKILPFYSRMIDTFLNVRPHNFQVLFANISHYGGSEVFST